MNKITILLIFMCIWICDVYPYLKIDLFRQKTPRENMLATENIPEYGVWLDWIKKPKPSKPIRRNDSIPLMRFLDSEFYGYINVGSPGKPMKVIFDTAWSTSWVLSKDCPTKNIGCWFHTKYDHDRSSSYKENGTQFIARESSFNLTGYYSVDEINFGHSTVKQTFVEMVGVPYFNIFTRSDGVIGMAMDRGDVTPFFYNILRQTNITKAVFSLYLNRDKSSKKGGSICLGAIDTKHIHTTNRVPDNITYVPVNTGSTMWEFTMDSVIVTIGNNSYDVCTTNCVAFADSSTNSLTVTKEYLKVINEKIGARPLYFGRFEVDCDTVNKMPVVAFKIGGTFFNLTGKEYVQKESVSLLTICISAFVEGTTSSETNRWLLGGAFLAKFFSVYDLENKQVGFVRAASA